MVSLFFKPQHHHVIDRLESSIDTAADEGSSSDLPAFLTQSTASSNLFFTQKFKITLSGSYRESQYSSLLHYRACRCLADDDIEKILATIQKLAYSPSQEKLLAKLIIALVNRGDSQLSSSKRQELIDKLMQRYFPKEAPKLAPKLMRAIG